MKSLLRTVTAVLLVAGAAHAQAPAASGAFSEDDREFLVAAARIAEVEIEAGQVALARSGAPAVRSFAQSILSEHERNYSRVLGIAQRERVDLEPLDATQSHMISQLREAPDASFDRAYVSGAIRGHMDASASLEKIASASHDAELRSYADQTLATVRTHLAQARRLEDQVVAVPLAKPARR